LSNDEDDHLKLLFVPVDDAPPREVNQPARPMAPDLRCNIDPTG